ncbi:uncharacterized protein LOC106459295 [Limulus polyphemus]|uniref:Uncharacterized protein LOC106459295 n=1 Tax=Limulus polyphemus TaxID=6850 RepID=A0ABM1B402_LIMPO|nr:uncharacterized protein LOC106459295 [Limulus polyphemus]
MWKLSMFLLLVLQASVHCRGYKCDGTEATKCQTGLLEKIGKDSRGFPKAVLNEHCRSLRQNMACLIKELTNCINNEIKEETRNILKKARKYVEKECHQSEEWATNQCFQKAQLTSCLDDPNLFNRTTLSRDTCGKYVNYRNCVSLKLQDCLAEAQQLVDVFLFEIVGELIWECPRLVQIRHKKDTSQLMGDAPSTEDLICLAKVSKDVTKCSEESYDSIKSSEKETSNNEKQRMICCTMKRLEDCVDDILEKECKNPDANLLKKALGKSAKSMEAACKDFDMDTCGVASVSPQIVLMAVLLLSCIFFLKTPHVA